MEYSKQDRQKLNAEGILANRETIIKIKSLINGVHCGRFVVCDTCPYHNTIDDGACGYIQINEIITKLVES
jgi:hypothetical protein